MSWLTLKAPTPCAKKQERVDRLENEKTAALRALRRSLHVANINRKYYYDAALADVETYLNKENSK
jgi:hypothetical protein